MAKQNLQKQILIFLKPKEFHLINENLSVRADFVAVLLKLSGHLLLSYADCRRTAASEENKTWF